MENSVNSKFEFPLEHYLITKNNFDLNKIKEASILLFDKPFEWTSFKLVKKIKYLTKANRVGHAGTLDPLATGLLIIATGKCTKLIEQIQHLPKVYSGTITMGNTTPSYDLETDFDQHFDYSNLTDKQIQETSQSFVGESLQTPPIYSAVKVNGTRAYKMARQGETPEIKSKSIVIDYFKLKNELPNLHFEIKCSKGTYIRTIAHEFGKRLDNGSHLSSLKRESIGSFNVNNAFDVKEFEEIIREI